MIQSIRRSQSLCTSSFAVLSCFFLAATACGSGARSSADSKSPPSSVVQTTSLLGTAQAFAVLAGSTVTNTGPTISNDNIGVNPGSAVTGFPPGRLTAGVIHTADAVSLQAQSDVTVAYVDLASRPC